MAGPKGKHNSLDSYDGTAAPVPSNPGYLTPAVKNINQADPKNGPRKGKAGAINNDSFSE